MVTKKNNKRTWKRPKKLTIGALTYHIRYITPGRGKELKEGETGCISQEGHLIEIDKNVSDQMSLLVLIHEILHGIGDAIAPNRSPFAKESFTFTVAELLTQTLASANLLPIVTNDLHHYRHDKQKGRN